ncbi:MAG: hypothetical protein M1820_003175 [Bogoriella megaspora]|nr:MAG: hypothetical protein M1820_003175 [Bogoriella megaspora]
MRVVSQTFNPSHPTTFALRQAHVNGPVSFLNPTRARFDQRLDQSGLPLSRHEAAEKGTTQEADDGVSGNNPTLTYQWTSRDNRKGRHRLRIQAPSKATEQESSPRVDFPPATNSPSAIANVLWLMLAYYPVWDISFDVAYLFTWGSVVWVINAFFAFLPLVQPSTAFPTETLYGGGITAFVGATIFEIGSVLLLLEAVNVGQEGCFGWAVENVWYSVHGESGSRPYEDETHAGNGNMDGHANGTVNGYVDGNTDALEKEAAAPAQDTSQPTAVSGRTQPARNSKAATISVRPSNSNCIHHHTNKHNLVGRPSPSAISTHDFAPGPSSPSSRPSASPSKRTWQWFPSFGDLYKHYMHELGFLASLVQFLAASVFWISGFTALPAVFNHLSVAAVNGAYWTPQVIGGVGFVISGLLFTLETQQKWWKPAPRTLGWWIGVLNTIGGLGFTLCPCFGYETESWRVYQASLSTFWGSWAFLLGSAVQWFESLQKWPVEVVKLEKK